MWDFMTDFRPATYFPVLLIPPGASTIVNSHADAKEWCRIQSLSISMTSSGIRIYIAAYDETTRVDLCLPNANDPERRFTMHSRFLDCRGRQPGGVKRFESRGLFPGLCVRPVDREIGEDVEVFEFAIVNVDVVIGGPKEEKHLTKFVTCHDPSNRVIRLAAFCVLGPRRFGVLVETANERAEFRVYKF
jgi:hypothetical protein